MKKIITWILYAIHFICFIVAKINLVGHPYGKPDRYGDYARGLYESEVKIVTICLIIMWIITVIMLIIQLVGKDENTNIIAEDPRSGCLMQILYLLLNHPTITAIIGSIIISVSFGSYS